MADKHKKLEIGAGLDTTKLTLEELTVDLSAFLQFLLSEDDSCKDSKITSYWSLIPDTLEVTWCKSVDDFCLKKNLHERKIYIYARPPEESLKESRKVELFNYFHSIIAQDQINVVTLLMSKLKTKDRKKLRTDFLAFKEKMQNSPS